LCLISLSRVGALKAVGLILAVAMIIAPGAIAFLLTKRFGKLLALSVLIAVAASLGGVYLSFFLDRSPAATLLLLLAGPFIAAFVFAVAISDRQMSPVWRPLV